MATNILMPALSPTMTEGTLAKWLVKEGDVIKSGTVMAEIETDKATMEFEAVDEGVMGKLLVSAGTANVAVNTPIAVLLDEGEKAGAAPAPAPKPVAAATAPVAMPAPAAAAPQSASPAPAARAGSGQRIIASPLAKRIAADKGVDLATIQGSGPHGRIVKVDVEGAGSGRTAPAAKAAPAIALPTGGYIEVPLSNMRKTIAKRLTESKQTIPHFYLTIDCEIDELLALRKRLNDKSDSYKLSVNDFVIRASAFALAKFPKANASWGGDKLLQYTDVDISVAVAIDDGLITPIIRKADKKGLAEISNEMKDLAARAKTGKLKLEEFQGGGFSISNLGMFGIKDFAAVINPPQAAILAIGAGEQRPVVKKGALAVATVMSVTLACDHRVIDGALGAQLLGSFKGYIEDPLTMLL